MFGLDASTVLEIFELLVTELRTPLQRMKFSCSTFLKWNYRANGSIHNECTRFVQVFTARNILTQISGSSAYTILVIALISDFISLSHTASTTTTTCIVQIPPLVDRPCTNTMSPLTFSRQSHFHPSPPSSLSRVPSSSWEALAITRPRPILA